MNRISCFVNQPLKWTFLLVLALGLHTAFAQRDSVYYGQTQKSQIEKKKKERNDEWKEKVTWGGNAQVWIGNSTFIFLSPTVGYLPFKKINIGIGAIYNYTSYRGPYGEYSQSIFGGHSYLRYIIGESYFLQAQYDRLYQPDFFSLRPEARAWVDYLLIGGGFRQMIGERTALISSLMYYVNPSPLSIYQNRFIIQFGITGTF